MQTQGLERDLVVKALVMKAERLEFGAQKQRKCQVCVMAHL